ncbi:23S rRNA (guanine745-N1)-methyltransferase [Planomicrobium koreense]|uniref:23S rRNA (Guanine745-N1)-methyltransferase n=1 Tax=Planococcus koreensis TaxID=112331 RepID=A0A7W8FUB5_9BACL|nr:class I SAM-dependent methyltransferase [Planococcus koreensis]MBB5180956.1 23S rRNA (guanine745-N1)-methyltransferase [Planococcus koreensis]
MGLMDPTKHPDWLVPHSLEWYGQLSDQKNAYHYSWNSTCSEPNGEMVFDEEVLRMIKGKKVLDVGCGHGEFTLTCSAAAKEIIGFDVIDTFVKAGNQHKRRDASFVLGNAHDGLPFDTGAFDAAYNRKGPTSAYLDLKRVVKAGGAVLGLHPGDQSGEELPEYFPGLFRRSKGTPILDKIHQRLEKSAFADVSIEILTSTEYLCAPIDVLKLRCFGQHPKIYALLEKEHMAEINRSFERNAQKEGLPITFSRYVVRARV